MVRAGRIAGRRTNPAVALPDQVFIAERLSPAVAPVLACLLVQVFGERLRQTIRQCLRHDRVVVVVLLLEPRAKRFEPDAAGVRKGAEMIRQSCSFWTD